jgi:hypothetical protein
VGDDLVDLAANFGDRVLRQIDGAVTGAGVACGLF